MKLRSDLSSGYFSTTTSRRESAPLSSFEAAIVSAGVPAPATRLRASVTRTSTFCSCAAKPFTVFTRFGIRSLRRCSWFWTSLQAASTASLWVTRRL